MSYYEWVKTFEMLKTMLELVGEATCKKMAGILNEHPSTCVSRGNSLGKRVKKILNLPACMDGVRERFFPIPFGNAPRFPAEPG